MQPPDPILQRLVIAAVTSFLLGGVLWAMGFLWYLPLGQVFDRVLGFSVFGGCVMAWGLTHRLIPAGSWSVGRRVMAIAALTVPATILVAGSLLLANGALFPGPPQAHSVEVLGTFTRDISSSGSARTSTAYRIRVRSWRDDREHEDLHGGNDFPVELFDLIEEGRRLQVTTRKGLFGWEYVASVALPRSGTDAPGVKGPR